MATDQSTTVSTSVEYRDIPGYPGYRVGSDGSVWSLWNRKGLGYGRGIKRVIGDQWHRINRNVKPNRHVQCDLCANGVVRSFLVHRLVLEAFVGPCPEGMEGCHDPDPDPTNNAIGNLRWDTRKENVADSRRHGTWSHGEKDGMSKLTEEDVRAIRGAFARGGVTQAFLAKKYGVTPTTINAVITRKTWRHM